MAKKIPTLSPDIISNTCSDISRIVEAKHLGQKGTDHEASSEGALLIGRRLEQEIAGYPISNLNGLLSPIACHLKQHFSPSLGPTYLKRCIKLARTVPEDMSFRPELDLEHYQSLARIADKDLRLDLMNIAADNRWSASIVMPAIEVRRTFWMLGSAVCLNQIKKYGASPAPTQMPVESFHSMNLLSSTTPVPPIQSRDLR